MTAPVQVGPSNGGGPTGTKAHLRNYRCPPTLSRPPRTSVTTRQIEILRHAGNGSTNRAIGRELGIGEESVKTHMQIILRKLRVNDRAQAVAVALRLGLISLEEIAVPEDSNYDCRRATDTPEGPQIRAS
ncbi:response regulator transcription factor [Streptomyces eurythermus]